MIDSSCVSLRENDIDKVTLHYLTNPSYSHEINESEKTEETEITKSNERRFYRRRIIAFTREMFHNPIQIFSIKNAFEEYAQTVITHLKMIDTEEIIQTEYEGLQVKNVSDRKESKEWKESKIEAANTDMMRKNILSSTLDNFVITNKVESQEILPKVKSINLLDPKLRTKGIKKRKEKKI